MQKITRLPFAFSLDLPEESKLSNEAYLESYIRFGAWLRLVTAYEQLELLKTSGLEALRRMSAVVATYQQVGMLLEDLATSFVAWTVWARQPAAFIADVLGRISLVREDKADKSLVNVEYVEARLRLLTDRLGVVRIEPARFFAGVHALGGREALALMGLDWKHTPSVKVAKDGLLLDQWRKLPASMEFLAHLLSHNGATELGSIFNKAKHGPQLVVEDLMERLREMGVTDSQLTSMRKGVDPSLPNETVRILFRGANLSQQEDGTRSTTYLDDYVPAIEQVVYRQMYMPTKAMWLVANWIARRKFAREWTEPSHIHRELESQLSRILVRDGVRSD